MKDDKSPSQSSRSQPIILQIFNELEDPRKKTINFRHPLTYFPANDNWILEFSSQI